MNKDISEYKPGQIWFSQEVNSFLLVLKVIKLGETDKVYFLKQERTEVRRSYDFDSFVFYYGFKLFW
jgi:hypothetical protein